MRKKAAAAVSLCIWAAPYAQLVLSLAVLAALAFPTVGAPKNGPTLFLEVRPGMIKRLWAAKRTTYYDALAAIDFPDVFTDDEPAYADEEPKEQAADLFSYAETLR